MATDILPAEEMLALDRWAVDCTLLLQRELQEHYGEYRFWNVYSKIHNFCVQELGGFYLDIIKDRQYTTGANSKARRSAQTALYHISEALVRWIAPILAFTADELWEYLPGERNESVMLNTWYRPDRIAGRLRAGPRVLGRCDGRQSCGEQGTGSPACGQGRRWQPAG